MINKIKKTARGFTIIETLIAILILTTALTGPITIAAKGLTGALEARDQLTAFYLAQDAIEYVRFARDTNTLCASSSSCTHPSDWLAGNGVNTQTNLTACEQSGGCYLDSTGNDPTAPVACGTTCPVLYYEKAGDYDYNSTTGTTGGTPGFVRTITITNSDGTLINGGTPTEVMLTVNVAWREPAGPENVSVKEELFNWH